MPPHSPMNATAPSAAAPADARRYRSKTLATWIAVGFGALGGLRFYLRGWRDAAAWLHWPPTVLGAWGAWRMHTLGQDDRLASVLVPLLGLMLSWAMLSAIVTGLTPDARWDERHNSGLEPRATGWGPVLGTIVALMVGGIVLMGTIAFAGQRFFEWQQQATLPWPVRTS
jgi:hypothetical protein